MVALKIRNDLTANELRRWARGEARGRPAARAYAIANALDGMSRADAAGAAGMERQALRDAVARYNSEGVAGLYDRPKGHPPPRLTVAERAALAEVVGRGPDPERDGVSAWTRSDLCRWLETTFSKTYSSGSSPLPQPAARNTAHATANAAKRKFALMVSPFPGSPRGAEAYPGRASRGPHPALVPGRSPCR